MRHQRFQGTMIGWRELFDQAAEFATGIGPRRLRSISHSASEGRGIVSVWYDDLPDEAGQAGQAGQAGGAPSFPLEVRCEFHRGTLISWDELFGWAAEFGEQLSREQLISVSHSDSKGDGIVCVWFWQHAT